MIPQKAPLTKMITKTDFLHWRECPIRLWLERVRPDLLPPPDSNLQALFAQGNEVDAAAREAFPGGIMVSGVGETAAAETRRLMGEAGTVFQPTFFSGDGLTCRADIIRRDERTGAWDIFEVKSSTSVKEEHLHDVAFQALCLSRAGVKLRKLHLVYVNNRYVRRGPLDFQALFHVEDVTNEARRLEASVARGAASAAAVLGWGRDVTPALITSCGDPETCLWARVALAGVADDEWAGLLLGLPSGLVRAWLEARAVAAGSVPGGLLAELGPGPWPKPPASGAAKVNFAGLRRELAGLEYPLYYLDYETYSPPIPWYDGYRPYQRVPFQFSLDVVATPGVGPVHHDFLATADEDPGPAVAEALARVIGPRGRVLAWNASFETGVNREIAAREPRHARFFEGVNRRVYDPMLVFKKGRLYADPRLGRKYSLKSVAPLLVGDPYAGLNIREGATASNAWPALIGRSPYDGDREQLRRDMLAYCAVDTMSMVRVVEKLREIAGL